MQHRTQFTGIHPCVNPWCTHGYASIHARGVQVDAYPLLLVCKDLLARFVARELVLISRRTEALAAALARAEELAAEQARYRIAWLYAMCI